MNTYEYGFSRTARSNIDYKGAIKAENADNMRKRAIVLLTAERTLNGYGYMHIWNDKTAGMMYFSYRDTPIWVTGNKAYTVSRRTGKLSGGEQMML